MRVAIIEAGPAGLFTGAALAQRGHRMTLVDRDPGPFADGWLTACRSGPVRPA